jgi:hypothetical protein
LAGSQKRIENDYEDTITKHEYEHEHAYEYDARRHDYDLQCDRIPGEVALQANADAGPGSQPESLCKIVIVSSCVVLVRVLVLVPRNRIFVIVLDLLPGISNFVADPAARNLIVPVPCP